MSLWVGTPACSGPTVSIRFPPEAGRFRLADPSLAAQRRVTVAKDCLLSLDVPGNIRLSLVAV